MKAFTAIFGKCLNYKSGLRFLILPPKVPLFWSQRWALLAKVTVFGPQKMALQENSKTTFIVQTFPKYGPDLASTLSIQHCWYLILSAPYLPLQLTLLKKGIFLQTISWPFPRCIFWFSAIIGEIAGLLSQSLLKWGRGILEQPAMGKTSGNLISMRTLVKILSALTFIQM